MTGLPVFCVDYRLAPRHRFPTAADAVRLVRLYCGDVDSADPRLALNVATGRTLPPTLIQAGGAEMLAADAHRLAADIRSAGGRCELQVWPDQVHVFQALPRLAPEAAQAMSHVASFVAEALSTTAFAEERTG